MGSCSHDDERGGAGAGAGCTGPGGNEVVDEGVTTPNATSLMAECIDAMKRQMDAMTERMEARMEAMQAGQARQHELTLEAMQAEQARQIVWAESQVRDCEAEAKRLQAEAKWLKAELERVELKKKEATAQLRNLRQRARDLGGQQVSKKRKVAAAFRPIRVSVWWEDEAQSYDGTVTDERAAASGSREVFVEYDDGDKLWHDTKETVITWDAVDPRRLIEQIRAPPQPPKRRKAATEPGLRGTTTGKAKAGVEVGGGSQEGRRTKPVSPTRPFQAHATAERLTPPARSHLSSLLLRLRRRPHPIRSPAPSPSPRQRPRRYESYELSYALCLTARLMNVRRGWARAKYGMPVECGASMLNLEVSQ